MNAVLLDYSLIPILGQEIYRRELGAFYKPQESFEKALELKKWCDARLDENGLISFDFDEYFAQNRVNFIDHPGIGWHDFPHPGIDRDGVSCPLNLLFLGFVRVLSEMARDSGDFRASNLQLQANNLEKSLRDQFFDGAVWHDARKNGFLSGGTSWQTNALAVYFEVSREEEAKIALQTMLDGYDDLCRCSPYFHFFLLPALRKAGLESEARELIKREWNAMLEGGATTAWEGFAGDAKDSLCHPWSTAPFLFLLDARKNN